MLKGECQVEYRVMQTLRPVNMSIKENVWLQGIAYVVVQIYQWCKIFQTSLILIFHCLIFIIII